MVENTVERRRQGELKEPQVIVRPDVPYAGWAVNAEVPSLLARDRPTKAAKVASTATND
jgi:hypothetical protein